MKARTLAFLGCVVGTVCLADGREGETTSVWSTDHGGPERNGYTERAVSDRLRVRWRYRAGDPVRFSPVGHRERIVFVTESGEVMALNPKGHLQWRWRPPPPTASSGTGESSVEAPPLLWHGRVIVGARGGRWYGLDEESGQLEWTYDTGGAAQGAATGIEGTSERPPWVVVVSQPDGVVHALEASTGRRVWVSEPTARCDGGASTDGRWIVFGNCASRLVVLNLPDGTLRGSVALGEGCQVGAGVALAQGRAYTGSRCGKMFAVDVAAGEIQWASGNPDTTEIFTIPAVGRGRVVAVNERGQILCWEAVTGNLLWVVERPRGQPRSPIIAGNRVVTAVGGSLEVLALEDGRVLFSLSLGDEISSPASIHDCLVVGNDEGFVIALESSGEAPSSPQPPEAAP